MDKGLRDAASNESKIIATGRQELLMAKRIVTTGTHMPARQKSSPRGHRYLPPAQL